MNAHTPRRRIALVQPPEVLPSEKEVIPHITASLATDPRSRGFSLAAPEHADLLVLLEANIYFGRERIPYYESLPWLTDPVRLCVVNYEDRPAGFLPGIYSSLHRRNFDERLHVSWPALLYYNDAVEAAALRILADGPSQSDDEWLFSFMGSVTNRVRRTIANTPRRAADRGYVVEINRWYDHTGDELRSYVDVLASSTFVLCPRGVAAYSHRILEALALGKVPDVIADEWVPFSIDSHDYYIRIREADAGRVADILRTEYSSAATELKKRAHTVYKRYFDARYRYALAFERLLDLQATHLSELPRGSLVSRWNSRRFSRSNGWALDQRIVRRLFQAAYRIRTMIRYRV